MNKTVNMNGQEIKAMVFKTSKSAENYMKNHDGSKIIFIKSGLYIVSK